jgi:transglutaminase-like putative cysteine protease
MTTQQIIIMDYRITHKTKYLYEEPSSLSYNEARLAPRTFKHRLFNQTCLSSELVVEPTWSDQRERVDFFGNSVYYFTIRQPHEKTIITATSEVRVESTETFRSKEPLAQLHQIAPHSPPWEQVRSHLQNRLEPELLEARQFTLNSPMITVFPELAAYATPSFTPARPILEAIGDLMGRIFHDFDFVPGATTIATPLSEVLQERRGVCQDFAHFMLACVRSQGLAARYISGYIETLPPPGKEKLVGADASHAWCAVYVPELGWIDFDPTNNLIPQEQHITLTWGRDFSDVTPLKGVFFSNGEHILRVSVDVSRVLPPEKAAD